VHDIIKDGCRAYEWLLGRVDASQIVCLGISSGAGCVLRVLQLALSSADQRPGYFVKDGPFPMPLGAALMSPFVDYTKEGIEGMQENSEYDLIVNPSILELAKPMCPVIGGDDEQRRWLSARHQPMEGLCPLLVSTSPHEACWTQDSDVVRLARDSGVEVQLQSTPYQCHVFQLMAAFTPEGEKAEAEIVAWMQSKLS